MSVNRYEFELYHCNGGEMLVSDTGDYVSYDDYAALESRCAAMAAELRAVEAIHNEAVFITDERYEQCQPEVQKIIKSLAVMQIPAYQAFLAEVRAQGVDMLAKAQEKIADEELIGGNFDLSLRFRGMSNAATEFAAQLRKGVQS